MSIKRMVVKCRYVSGVCVCMCVCICVCVCERETEREREREREGETDNLLSFPFSVHVLLMPVDFLHVRKHIILSHACTATSKSIVILLIKKLMVKTYL